MERKFKVGDHVIIAEWSFEYDGKYRGCYGVVRYPAIVEKVGVELYGITNAHSASGFFWIHEKNLVLENDEKKVLIGDPKTGYSYVTPKEVEEMRINAEINKEKIEDAQVGLTKIILNSIYGIPMSLRKDVEITKVIFNNPATIVFWSDGKKTVVKCADDEAFDEEKGLAMAISKRVLGNNGNYYNEFKKWLPKIDICEDDDAVFLMHDNKTLGVLDGTFRKTFVGDE